MFSKIKKALVYIAIVALTLQSSMILSFFNPEKAMAATPNIRQLSIITAPQTINQNTASTIITAQTQDLTGNPETVSESTTLILTSDSSTGLFSLNGTSAWASSKNTTFSSGSTKGFYYKDSTIGTHTITVSAENKDWTVATQAIIIQENPAKPTAASIEAGVNNPANYINNANKTNVSVSITLPATSLGTDTITAELSDGVNTKTGTTFGCVGTGIVIVSGIDTTDPLNDGPITVKAKVTNQESESSAWFDGTSATKDTVNPTGSIVLDDGADVSNNRQISADFTASEDTDKMKLWGDIDKSFSPTLNNADWIDFENELDLTLSENDGIKTVYVQFKDEAGNESSVYSSSIFFSHYNSGENPEAIAQGPNIIDPFSNGNVEMTIDANSPTTLFSSTYSQNPVGTKSGISFLNKYYDFSLANDEAINFPVFIKFYYTLDDLAAVGITNESQLLGLYYFDHADGTWKIYSADGRSTTGVNTTDVNGYAGYVWVNAYHFTPMTIGADITAPEKPANFTATAKDGEIELKWDKVESASGYYVRYREGTSIDNKEYSTIYINGANNLNTKVTGLTNSTLYEFGVRAIDMVGNLSDWAVVISSPVTSVTLAKAETIKPVISYQLAQSSAEEEQSPTNGETEITTIGPDEGQIKSESAFSWSRFWITLAILLIAAGAAYGGYYGYQWWMEKPKKTKKDNTPKPPTSSTDKTGRW